jgi:thymidine phosphorylase
VDRIGCSIAGTTLALVPADRRMYALRDVSGIIEAPPLIVASILSKKASARLEGLVLDVKVGSGAFMRSTNDARALARLLVDAAADLGMRAEALLTNMEAPLGRSIGNALEVAEAIRFLRGEQRSPDLEEVCRATGKAMLRVGRDVGGTEVGEEEADRRLDEALLSGAALEKLSAMIDAHGGDARVTEDPGRLPSTKTWHEAGAREPGWVGRIDAREIGEAVVDLGGGRRRVEDAIDPRVGVEILVRCGEPVVPGQPLARVHLAEGHAWDAALRDRVLGCFSIVSEAPEAQPAILDRLTSIGPS